MNTKTLVKALKTVSLVTEKRSTMPILETVRISATPEHLTIRGTDLDNEITATVPGYVPNMISLCVQPKELIAALGDSEDAILQQDGDVLLVNGLAVETVNEDFFPAPMGWGESKNESIFYAEKLGQALAKTIPCASTDHFRYNINGIFFEPNLLVSTDGHRLATVELGHEINGIMSLDAAKILQKLCSIAGTIQLAQCDSTLRIEARETNGTTYRMTSKLIDGQYPDWRQAVPKEFPVSVSFERKELTDALKRLTAGQTKRETYKAAVRLSANGHISLASVAKDKPSRKIQLSQSSHRGPDLTIGICAGYLADYLATMPKGETFVMLEGSSELQPVILHGADMLSKQLVMPMRFE
jgi:DNA polymerase-3 subunit beta